MGSEKNEKQTIKVTDKRLFTADGDIREEFQEQIRPAEGDPLTHAQSQRPPEPTPEPPPQAAPARDVQTQEPEPEEQESGRARGENPGTPFSSFIEQLVVQAYMSLGMLRSPYGDVPVDLAAAKQMIEILKMLQEKTSGNLTRDESEFLETHLGELKLNWVRQSKSI